MADEVSMEKSGISEWWRSLDLGEDPITMEDLSTLSYPPFLLKRNYFDGFALASFIVSRGIFQNPLTREELTLQDCRLLDEYLEEFCYKDDTVNTHLLRGSTRQKVSVAEAYSLRNSVQVETSASGATAEALRNAATSALVGLFVYGNARTSQQGLEEQSDELQLDPTLLDWGFDLSRTVHNTAQIGSHGYMIIDDDEANVVASQRSAYQTVQEAFPPLHGQNEETDYQRTTIPDEHFLDHVRSMSLQEQQVARHRLERLRVAREKLLKEALQRREERRQQRQKELAQNTGAQDRLKQDTVEIEEARAEIEAWREEQ